MVVFNCNACGEALKKNQVEKHYTTQCRKCEVLSCVDCGKEFWGNDYEQHTKCVSEEQKYGGKNFKPKANANKGEQKQELWVNQVHAAVSKVKTNIKLKNLLEQLVDYPNIPRKKAKFENFLRNSLRVYESSMATAAWDAISAELSVSNNNNSENGNKAEKNGLETVTCETEKTEQSDEDSGTLSKKKKKDKLKNRDEGKVVEETTEAQKSESERQEKSKKKSKKEKQAEKNKINEGENAAKQNGDSVHDNGEHVGNGDKKKKKRKIDEVEQEQNRESKNKKKKNKHSTDDDESTTVNADMSIADGAQTDITSPVEGSFKWDAAIVGVLKRAPDQQLKLSKLRKKVLAEFNTRGGDGKIYTEEKLMSKFDKKLQNSQKFKLNKDLVKLVKR